jgi:hypothetical protein
MKGRQWAPGYYSPPRSVLWLRCKAPVVVVDGAVRNPAGLEGPQMRTLLSEHRGGDQIVVPSTPGQPERSYFKFSLNQAIIRSSTSFWCAGVWNEWPSFGYTTISVFTPSVFSAW